MARTKGAKDKKKRKHRRIKKKKYMIRKGKFVPYVSKRQRGDPIKIWFWKREKMSIEGYRRWSKNLRAKAYKKITKFGVRIDVPPEMLSNDENIKQLANEFLYEGEWLLMGFSHGRTKTHVKPVMLCRIFVRDSKDGYNIRITDKRRLSRYWFWKG